MFFYFTYVFFELSSVFVDSEFGTLFHMLFYCLVSCNL